MTTDLEDRASVKRKDSGMSGMKPRTPEAATPKTRDFATINTNRNARNEKHDTNKAVDNGSSKKAPASILTPNKHKENSNMLRRMKNMALAPLHIAGAKA